MIENKILAIKQDFPILQQKINGHDLVFLDNASTTQKPKIVIDALVDYYQNFNANIHRGVYQLSEKSTNAYELARQKLAKFIHAASPAEIIFTSGTTAAINLVAASFGQIQVQAGDEIVMTAMEHHANLVPWQQLCQQKSARLKVAPLNEKGELVFTELEKLLTERVKILAISHISNVLGTINPIKQIIQLAKRKNIAVLVDGAQAVAHMKIDVQDLDADFYVFSGHKIYAPTGIGVLYAKQAWLNRMPPYQTGGGMIEKVTFEKTTFAKAPEKFEAGTPNIAAAVGLSAAIDYIEKIGFETIINHEKILLAKATQVLQTIPGLKIIGEAENKSAVISFVMENIHAHDIATILDYYGVAIRAGHHCAMPLMHQLGLNATARASFAIYNTLDDIEKLKQALLAVKRVFV